MELSIDEINNLTKNNDELMARNEELEKALEFTQEKEKEYLNLLKKIVRICDTVTEECECRTAQDFAYDIIDKIDEVLK